jgi:hypothetical protein
MRKLIGTIALGLVIVGAIGWSRGWFSLVTSNEGQQTQIELTIDKERLKQDTERVKEEVQELTGRVRSSGATGEESGDRWERAPVIGGPDGILPPGSDGSVRPILPPDLP